VRVYRVETCSARWAALTNVEYGVTITDTLTGATWIHHNPAETLQSFADIAAF
jgi:hypothetical protein